MLPFQSKRPFTPISTALATASTHPAYVTGRAWDHNRDHGTGSLAHKKVLALPPAHAQAVRGLRDLGDQPCREREPLRPRPLIGTCKGPLRRHSRTRENSSEDFRWVERPEDTERRQSGQRLLPCASSTVRCMEQKPRAGLAAGLAVLPPAGSYQISQQQRDSEAYM
jgi:hypothetical protein